MKSPNGFDVIHPPTWRNTLNNDARKFGHITELTNVAVQVGYQYICWNDRIYLIVTDDTDYAWEADTGWTIDLLEFENR